MAIREYIGARYVPIFDGDWDITKTYEPLVIVNYQGNSFTSKKYVPSGVQITNTDYWAESGNYSQQIEQLRQELNAATQDIADLQDIVTDPIAVAHGGTGSSTAAGARAALDITPANIGALPASAYGLHAANVSVNNTWQTSMIGSSALISISRGSYWALCLVDYWSSAAQVIAQSTNAQTAGLPTITKQANSYDFEITNDHNTVTIAVQVYTMQHQSM